MLLPGGLTREPPEERVKRLIQVPEVPIAALIHRRIARVGIVDP
jgi:hypothetical protein